MGLRSSLVADTRLADNFGTANGSVSTITLNYYWQLPGKFKWNHSAFADRTSVYHSSYFLVNAYNVQANLLKSISVITEKSFA